MDKKLTETSLSFDFGNYKPTDIDKAIRIAHQELRKIFGSLLCNLVFLHSDNSGFWFSFALVNDSRIQTFCVRPWDLDEIKLED